MSKKKTDFSGEFEQALAQRSQTAQTAGAVDADTLMQAELVVAGIERQQVGGMSAHALLIARGEHVPSGSTNDPLTGTGEVISKAAAKGARHPHIGGAEFGESRKTEADRTAIVERQTRVNAAVMRGAFE